MDENQIVLNAALPSQPPASAYRDDEIAGDAAGIQVFGNKKLTKLPATVYNQWFTSSCVAHAFLTALEYEGIITPEEAKSQLLAYRRRINFDGEGMVAHNAWDILRSGTSPYADGPMQNRMTEAAANAMRLISGTPELRDKFNHFDITDYRRIAMLVAQGKAVPVFIYGTQREWAREYVSIEENVRLENAIVRHAVVLVPRGDFTENGQRYFTVHDSAAFGRRHLRYVTEDFIVNRAYYAARIERKVPTIQPPAPDVDRLPDVACKYDDRGDAVLALQRFLFDQGMFEARFITGFYGRLTANAVLWFQLKNHHKFSNSIPELLALKGEHWGPQSIKAAI